MTQTDLIYWLPEPGQCPLPTLPQDSGVGAVVGEAPLPLVDGVAVEAVVPGKHDGLAVLAVVNLLAVEVVGGGALEVEQPQLLRPGERPGRLLLAPPPRQEG